MSHLIHGILEAIVKQRHVTVAETPLLLRSPLLRRIHNFTRLPAKDIANNRICLRYGGELVGRRRQRQGLYRPLSRQLRLLNHRLQWCNDFAINQHLVHKPIAANDIIPELTRRAPPQNQGGRGDQQNRCYCIGSFHLLIC